MSVFYDEASLVVVPSGYKSGKIYAQKPLTTDGQLTFTRASTATRVNASGLIEEVASGVPRLDYLGSTCPKLLLEPQRTNSVAYSEQLNLWTAIQGTVTANAATSPDGTANADKFVADNGVEGLLQQLISITAATHTFSAFAKADGLTSVSIQSRDNASAANFAGVNFNLSTGAVSTTSETGAFSATSGTITAYGNGWYRCTMTFTSSISTNTRFRFNTATGDGTNAVLLYGAQAELGAAYATSYVKTEAAAVTRLDDTCYKTGISSLIGQTAGTIYAEWTANNATPSGRILSISDGTTANRLSILEDGGKIRIYMAASSVLQADITNLSTYTGTHKIAVAYAANDLKIYIDGVAVGTSTSITVPACSYVGVGTFETTLAILPIGGGIKQALLFKTRLSNAKLAELTSL